MCCSREAQVQHSADAARGYFEVFERRRLDLAGKCGRQPVREDNSAVVVEDVDGGDDVDVKAEEVGVGPVGGLVGVGGLDRGCKTTAFRR